MKHVIYCDSFEMFMDCIQSLTIKGLTFKARTESLQIELTGGY
ncbi:hypothetical protein [Vibrio phage vB_ValA_R15Z]|uniref:Uncharacterized protein n=1 Tax=Vibrio phage vB_ValA_R15Z TaxID=3044218 RepID=A0AA49XC67_9CAUD|nr:hypothetical protein [Vibrio phage vB_ValA_R15Z]